MEIQMPVDLIDQLLTTHPGDPANARYVVPFDDPQLELEAQCIAGAIYIEMAGPGPDDREEHAADWADLVKIRSSDPLWVQCLIDARRMSCDEEYARIFDR
jgi:hypothetical protein